MAGPIWMPILNIPIFVLFVEISSLFFRLEIKEEDRDLKQKKEKMLIKREENRGGNRWK